MALTWEASHDNEPAGRGFDGRMMVAQVAFYDRCAETNGPGWRAFLAGQPVAGVAATVEEAQQVAEDAYKSQKSV